MASPVGIAAGYARLAESVADALDARDAEGSTAAEAHVGVTVERLAKAVSGLIRSTDGCRICSALDRVERDHVERLTRPGAAHAAEDAVNDPPVLCLRHLGAVLAAGPDPEYARALTDAMAARLRRTSEDMRSFVLTREAIRRALVTTEEGKAYTDALRLLAGLPSLARPWSLTID
jgi:hypothetical protein